MDDLFNAMVKDSEGKDIPNILVSEQAEDDADNAKQFSRSRWETRQTQELREIQITWISKRTKNGESRIAKRGE